MHVPLYMSAFIHSFFCCTLNVNQAERRNGSDPRYHATADYFLRYESDECWKAGFCMNFGMRIPTAQGHWDAHPDLLGCSILPAAASQFKTAGRILKLHVIFVSWIWPFKLGCIWDVGMMDPRSPKMLECDWDAEEDVDHICEWVGFHRSL